MSSSDRRSSGLTLIGNTAVLTSEMARVTVAVASVGVAAAADKTITEDDQILAVLGVIWDSLDRLQAHGRITQDAREAIDGGDSGKDAWLDTFLAKYYKSKTAREVGPGQAWHEPKVTHALTKFKGALITAYGEQLGKALKEKRVATYGPVLGGRNKES